MQRLLARLPDTHRQYEAISQKLYQSQSGYAGELIVDRILNEIDFPQGSAILKDFTVEINPNFLVQIDTLILTPSHAMLLEIKNYAGTVFFDELSGKTTKISPEGKIEKFDCIIHQLDRAATGIQKWLIERQIQLPLEAVLVMANQKTEIQEMPKTVPLKFGKQLSRYIRSMPGGPEIMTSLQITTIANHLYASSVKWKRKPACEKYEISPAALKTGVLCLDCNSVMPRRRGRTWTCDNCGNRNEDALLQAVADWYLLISPTLTNKQLRTFLALNSNSAASVIFRQLRLKRKGIPPGTVYTWDYKLPLMKRSIRK